MKLINLFEGPPGPATKAPRRRARTDLVGITQGRRTGLHVSKWNLESLKGCPEIIYGPFFCDDNLLESLKYGPKEVRGDFNCSANHLKSLEFAPAKVDRDLFCGTNEITSLKDIHKIILELNGELGAGSNPITSNILGVLYIKGCKRFHIGDYFHRAEHAEVYKIINGYLPNNRGHKSVFECQCELQDAGLDEYAQL